MISRGSLPRKDSRNGQYFGSQSRHTMPKMYPDTSCSYTAAIPAYESYSIMSQPQDFSIDQCWSGVSDSFSGNDHSYMAAAWVSPTEIMNAPWDSPATDAGSTRSSVSSLNCNTPPHLDVELDPYMDGFPAHYQDWSEVPQLLTPPDDTLELFANCKDIHSDLTQLPEPAIPAIAYQSPPAQRTTQPRPIRSASERSFCASSPSGSSKGQTMERTKNNPRNDSRYDAKPNKDGEYICPFTGSPDCNHKPTRQKCIYAKNLDSHLKPYVCKHREEDDNCRPLRFSSNACLFRHEREMHGMHNHGINPYQCRYEGCERAMVGNGFPRQWNARDHMKRVHGWEETEADNDTGAPAPRRRKGPGASNSVPMKRSGSSRVTAPYYTGSRPSTTPRYISVARKAPGPDYMLTSMPQDNLTYGPQRVLTANFSGPIYSQVY